MTKSAKVSPLGAPQGSETQGVSVPIWISANELTSCNLRKHLNSKGPAGIRWLLHGFREERLNECQPQCGLLLTSPPTTVPNKKLNVNGLVGIPWLLNGLIEFKSLFNDNDNNSRSKDRQVTI